jgi:hypothetical protein
VPSAEEIEFVNRTEELEALRVRIPPLATAPTLTFLRSPSGYGKSRLTDRLVESLAIPRPTCVIVDPAIRSKSRSDRVYAWFFVQRAAEPTAIRTHNSHRHFRTFAQFVRKQHPSHIHWRALFESLKEVTSPSKLIKIAIDLAEDIFKRGRYSPDALLQNDGSFATQLAQDYVRALANYRPTVFVIRECQNIDPESLRFFLTLGADTSHSAVIFEYTTLTNRFSSDHEKLIFETVVPKDDSLMVFDLLRLSLGEFRNLLKRHAPVDKTIEAAVELSWDGNLRIIKEMKYRLMVGASGDTAHHPLLLPDALRANISALPKRRRLLLALMASHVEAIGRDALFSVLRRIDSSVTSHDFEADINELATKERYLQVAGAHVALADEDLLESLTSSPAMVPLMRLADTGLRNFYLDILDGKALTSVPLQSALRQAIALCARTGDIVALRSLVRSLDSAVRQSYDQTLYVTIVADTVIGRTDLSELERRELVEWASAAAYEVGDFPTAVSLLESLPETRPYDDALLACCYGEVNRHDEAVTLARRLRSHSSDAHADVVLVSRLIECANLFANGKKGDAAALHAAVRSDSGFSTSPLFGFVLRFTEIIHDFPECTEDVLKSVELLRSHGLGRSAAYSQLAAAMHLSYAGQLDLARRLVSNAKDELLPYVRDRQIILNNEVVLELLAAQPKVDACLRSLDTALFTVRDDFSRLVLQNNRLICCWLLGDITRATHCAAVIEDILRAPGFGNRDVFWTTCFNAWAFFAEIGDVHRAEEFKNVAFAQDINECCYQSYWRVRFGLDVAAESKFEFLLRFKYHPEYLSHWVIDLDGLAALKARFVQ